jgi:reverse gyrase
MSIGTARGERMGRKKKGEGDSPPTVTVKLERVLVGRAKIVATEMGVDLAQYLSDQLRPVVNKDWTKVLRSMDKEESK